MNTSRHIKKVIVSHKKRRPDRCSLDYILVRANTQPLIQRSVQGTLMELTITPSEPNLARTRQLLKFLCGCQVTLETRDKPLYQFPSDFYPKTNPTAHQVMPSHSSTLTEWHRGGTKKTTMERTNKRRRKERVWERIGKEPGREGTRDEQKGKGRR